MPNTPNPNVILALLMGLLTGVVSTAALEAVVDFDLNPGGDRFGIQTLLTQSAGLCFGLLAPVFLKTRLGVRQAGLIACAAGSIIGMFLAAEVTFRTHLSLNPFGENNFILGYLAGSVVGATVLGGAVLWAASLKPWRRPLGQCVLWPTLWALLIGVALSADGSGDALEIPFSVTLFVGWQAAFLAALAGTWPSAHAARTS